MSMNRIGQKKPIFFLNRWIEMDSLTVNNSRVDLPLQWNSICSKHSGKFNLYPQSPFWSCILRKLGAVVEFDDPCLCFPNSPCCQWQGDWREKSSCSGLHKADPSLLRLPSFICPLSRGMLSHAHWSCWCRRLVQLVHLSPLLFPASNRLVRVNCFTFWAMPYGRTSSSRAWK